MDPITVGLVTGSLAMGGFYALVGGLMDHGIRSLPSDQARAIMGDLRAGGFGSVADHYGY